MTADDVIALLGLQPLPVEGGYYRETWRSTELHERSGKCAGTAIYYLLTPDTVSALHRLPTDEVYHFYTGDPVELFLLDEGGGRVVTLGSDLAAGHAVQAVAPAGTWQGSALATGGRFALMGTTMAPGFAPDDFEPGHAPTLIREHPAFAAWITRLAGGFSV